LKNYAVLDCKNLQKRLSVNYKMTNMLYIGKKLLTFVNIKQIFAKKHWIDPELTMIRNPLNDCSIYKFN